MYRFRWRFFFLETWIFFYREKNCFLERMKLSYVVPKRKGKGGGQDSNEMVSQTRRIVRRIRNGTKKEEKKQMPPHFLFIYPGTSSIARNI